MSIFVVELDSVKDALVPDAGLRWLKTISNDGVPGVILERQTEGSDVAELKSDSNDELP